MSSRSNDAASGAYPWWASTLHAVDGAAEAVHEPYVDTSLWWMQPHDAIPAPMPSARESVMRVSTGAC